MSMADYVPGGEFPGSNELSDGVCAEKCVCNALDHGLYTITEALYTIDQTLEKLVKDPCDVIDKCKKQIIDIIDQRFRGSQKTCEECQADAANGLAGTLDYAIACAGACTSEAKRLCEDGSEPPCEPEQPKKAFIGYCNRLTGNYFAAIEGSTPIDPLASAVSRAVTEEVAFQEAQEYCTKYYHPIDLEPDPQPLQSIGLIGTFCDIESFYSGAALRGITTSGETAFGIAGLVKTFKSLSHAEIKGINLENAGELTTGIFEANQNAAPTMARLVLPGMAAALGCSDPQWQKAIEIVAAMDIVRDKTGIDLRQFATSIEYAANASCRRKFLSAREATEAYLHSDMSDKTLDSHYAIEGECHESVRERLDYMKSRPSPADLVSMLHRGIINVTQYYAEMRLNGFIDQGYSTALLQNSTYIFDVGTVLGLQTDSVLDDAFAAKYGLDNHSAELYAGPLKAHLAARGLNDNDTKLLWRGHWRDVGLADLYQFARRSRGDNSFGEPHDRLQDVQDGCNLLGIPPYYVNNFVAATFEPLTIRNIHTAYVDGVITDKDLPNILYQTQYNESAITTFARQFKIDRRKHAIGHIAITQWTEQQIDKPTVIATMTADGYSPATIDQATADAEYKFETSSWSSAYVRGMMTREQLIGYLTAWGVTGPGALAISTKLSFRITDHRSIKGYIAGTLTDIEAIHLMILDGLTSESAGSLLAYADDIIAADTATSCVAGLRSRYLNGEITEDETRTYMVHFGIAAARANQYISSFHCARAAEGRTIPIERLCHWLYIGAISQPDFHDRLLRLGYSEANASLLLYDCVQANTLRSIKEANRVAKELQSQADKQRRAIQSAERSRETENKRLANARKAKAALRAARDKQLLTSAERLSNSTSVNLVTAMGAVRAALQSAQENHGLTVDEALKIIVLASEQMKGEDITAFVPLADQLAAAAETSGLEPTDEELGIPPSSNGSTQPSGPTTPLA